MRSSALTLQTDALSGELRSLRRRSQLTADERDRVCTGSSTIELYRDAIAVVGSMLEIDFPSAVELIKPFDGNARKVLAALEAMSRRAARDADDARHCLRRTGRPHAAAPSAPSRQ